MGIFITAASDVEKKNHLTQLAAGFPGGRGSPGERNKQMLSGDGADPGGFQLSLELVTTCGNHPVPLKTGAQKQPWSCSPLVPPDSSHPNSLGWVLCLL